MRTGEYNECGMRSCTAIIFCATAISTIVSVLSAQAQTTSYDGVYAGLQTLTKSGNYTQCVPGPFKRKLVVVGGTATYEYNPTYQGNAKGVVSESGDVSANATATNDTIDLTGKIQGTDFSGELRGTLCTYAVQLKRVP